MKFEIIIHHAEEGGYWADIVTSIISSYIYLYNITKLGLKIC